MKQAYNGLYTSDTLVALVVERFSIKHIAKYEFLHKYLSLAPLDTIIRILENSLKYIKQAYIWAVYWIKILTGPFISVLVE